MRSFRLMALLAMCLMLLAAPVQAKTTITFWHGMGGELGEITDRDDQGIQRVSGQIRSQGRLQGQL